MNLQKLITWISGLLPVLALTACALAGGDGMKGSPKPEDYTPIWMPILISLGFLVAIGIVGFKCARRAKVE